MMDKLGSAPVSNASRAAAQNLARLGAVCNQGLFPLANAATPYGEILSAARRDGLDFVRRCVTRRSFAISKFLSSRLAAHKIGLRRGHVWEQTLVF